MGTWVDEAGRPAAESTPGSRKIPLTVKKYSDSLLTLLLKGRSRRPTATTSARS